jgi:membrane protease YdiL (CAAX protease family)
MIAWTLALAVFAYALPSWWNARLIAQDQGGLGKRRPGTGRRFLGWRLLLRQVLIALFVVLTGWQGLWTLTDIGGRKEVDPALGFGLGALIFIVFYFAYLYRLFRRNQLDAQEEHINRVGNMLWPQERSEKVPAFVGLVILNPLNEEFIFRGILIQMWANELGSVWAPLIIGLFLHLMAHIYQGAAALMGFVILYIFFVVLLFSPLGIWGALGFHVMADLVPLALMRPRKMPPQPPPGG